MKSQEYVEILAGTSVRAYAYEREFVCCAGTAACRRRWRRFTRSSTQTPQLGMPLRNGDAQGEDKEREMWREFKRGEQQRKRKSGVQVCVCVCVCVFIFRLSCHELFKGYILPPTHLGMRVKVEEFPLLFSILPRTHFCWCLFLPPLFPFKPPLPVSLLALSHSRHSSCCPANPLALHLILLVLPWKEHDVHLHFQASLSVHRFLLRNAKKNTGRQMRNHKTKLGLYLTEVWVIWKSPVV